jgi:murein DD-endopeptidase MepM/ murein hydrolase activator NlpD
MQTLRGHTLQISALAFDSERIISVSGDNTVRYWQWGQSTAPTDKVHVLDKGETLLSVAKRYSIKVDELMRWNGITDVRQCFAGMNLIVRKADPDAPTDAEKLLLQKEKRLEGGARLAEKISKDSAATDAMMEEGARLSKYNRVHKIATDIDFFSLGNRLFGEQKRQLELFPDQIDPNVNTRSLAGRFRADEERRKEEKRAEGKGMSDFEQAADNEEDAAALAWALKTGSKVRPRYFISTDNEDEWGEVANGLAIVMLQMLVEYEAYEVVMEQKRMLRSKQSVIGRINTRQLELELLQRKEEAEAAAAAAEGARPPPPAAAAGSEPLLLLGHGGAEIVVSDITPSTGSLTVQESPKPASFLPPLGVTQGAAHAGGLLEPIAEEGAGPGHVGDVGHEVPAPPLSRAEQARQRQEARAAEVARRKAAIKRAIAGSSTAEGASAGNDSDGSKPSSSRPRSRHSAGKQDAGKQETGNEEPLRLPPI